MDTDKHMVGTQTKANTLDDKGIQRMCHYGFSERAEGQSKFKGLVSGQTTPSIAEGERAAGMIYSPW